VPADGIDLYLSSGLQNRLPERLELRLRGLWKKRVSAYWNGQTWVG
jgi:hypothetical protein